MSIENNEYLLISWLLYVRNQSEFMNMCSECVVSNWECEYYSAICKTDSGSQTGGAELLDEYGGVVLALC
jgi:hypothetical protein